MPGLTYSYGFEAWDKAGNKRNFMGDGFELPPYRLKSDGGVMMLFSRAELPTPSVARITAPPAILLEAAGWINQIESVDGPVRIEVAARSYEQATGWSNRSRSHLPLWSLGIRVGFLPWPVWPRTLQSEALSRSRFPDPGEVC